MIMKEIEKILNSEDKQMEYLKLNSDKIKYLMGVKKLEIIVEEPQVIKLSFFEKIKNIIIIFFNKKEEPIIETHEEIKPKFDYDIYLRENKQYEDQKYYDTLEKIRKESGGIVINKSPLLYEPDMCVIHNEDPNRKHKADLKYFILTEKEETQKILNKQNVYQDKLDVYYKKNH